MAGDASDAPGPNKGFKKSTKGAKANKKRVASSKATRGEGNRNNNPRAFKAFQGPGGVRAAARTLEQREKKQHAPAVDRSAEVTYPAPHVVAVVGPPQCGKSTLIKSLVKHYTKQSISGDIKGPITVVTGKARRLTFIECPNDLHAMCDVAKIADLVLLLVDGSFGFEMEVFEFLNICQVRMGSAIGLHGCRTGAARGSAQPAAIAKDARWWAQPSAQYSLERWSAGAAWTSGAAWEMAAFAPCTRDMLIPPPPPPLPPSCPSVAPAAAAPSPCSDLPCRCTASRASWAC